MVCRNLRLTATSGHDVVPVGRRRRVVGRRVAVGRRSESSDQFVVVGDALFSEPHHDVLLPTVSSVVASAFEQRPPTDIHR